MDTLISLWTLVGSKAYSLLASGVAHLFASGDTGCHHVLLAIILSDKKLRDPASILLICITVQCIFGPLAYGLLTDIGLIANVPANQLVAMFCVLFDHNYFNFYS